MKVGGVELKSGKITDLKIDSVPTAPAFNSSNAGQFTFSLDDKVLRFNNGSGLIALNSNVSEDPNLISSLGSNWLNGDLTFNPVPFNGLPGISGLTSGNSLFDVISQLSSLASTQGTIEISQLSVPPGTPDASVLATLAGSFILLTVDQVLQASTINLNINDINGFNVTSTNLGNMLVFDGTGNLVSKNVSYTYENFTSSVNHTVNHGLGKKYCVVFCINPNTGKSVNPSEITFVNENQLLVTLPSSQPLVALVLNLAD